MPDLDVDPTPGGSGFDPDLEIIEGLEDGAKSGKPTKKSSSKPKKSEPELDFLNDMTKQFGKVSEKICEDNDENSAWARMIAIQLRKLDPFDAAVFRLDTDSRLLEMTRPKHN